MSADALLAGEHAGRAALRVVELLERDEHVRPRPRRQPNPETYAHRVLPPHDALALVEADAADLLAPARALRERGKGRLVTYSPKVFIPLTKLCRDVCHYCTFAAPPKRGERAYLTADEVLDDRARRRRGGLQGGAVHARRQAGAALPGRPGGAGRARLRDDDRVPRAHVPARARRDRPAPAREPRRDDARRASRAARGDGVAGDHARDGLRPAVRARRPALRLAGQAPRGPARDPAARRRGAHPVHERDPDRDRRDAAGADRGAARDPRAARAPRAHPGGDRPELPRQAGDADGGPRGAVARRAALDGCGGAARARPGHERPVPAEPELRRLPAAPRGRDQRLGRRLAGDDRPRQPGGALAGDRAARRRHPRGRR